MIFKGMIGLSNIVLGCVAGGMLVMSTHNPIYYIINAITAMAGGILIADAFSEDSEVEK